MPVESDEVRRENARRALWRQVTESGDPPDDEIEFLTRVYESSAVGGKDQLVDVRGLVREIVWAYDKKAEQDDFEQFISDSIPTTFFFEQTLAFVSSRDGERESDLENGDSDHQEDDDADAVDAHAVMWGLDTLRNLVEWDRLDLNPPWQRTDVWSIAKKRELIKSILLGIPIPSIILHKVGENHAVIDGKQRLTAIIKFLRNEYKLPNYKVDPGHPLFECRGCWYDKVGPRTKSLDASYRGKIVTTQIPVLLFRNVPEKRLRQIFNLYNVTSVRLNPAEVRNAVYQHNPIHRAMFILAGENLEQPDLGIVKHEDQIRFSRELRTTLPSTHRFATLDFLCRYLGYSRAALGKDKHLSASSTSATVNKYFDFASDYDHPEDVVPEIIRVFRKTSEFFDLDEDDPPYLAFFRTDKNRRMKFHALQGITCMICTRLLDDAINEGLLSTKQVADAIAVTVSKESPPEGQTSTTIWDYQARFFLRLVKESNLDLSKLANTFHAAFAERMRQVISLDEQ